MIYMNCDYLEGCHPAILAKLSHSNLEQTIGYGEDAYCKQAAEMILEKCQLPDGQVHFFTGGTQANLTVIASLLRPFEGVLSPDTGHINVHETGAIEATGHKVMALPSVNGKITAAQVEDAVFAQGGDEHMVRPGMVYISFPTEVGTLYSHKELSALYSACVKHGLVLYIDGARLGYGLTAPANDVTLSDLGKLCHIFTIGGTKVGALFGEAVVMKDAAHGRDFRYLIKQKGAMLAKGRLLGLQFIALMENDLYFDISHAAIKKALVMKDALLEKGIPLLIDSPTNQQFPIFPNAMLDTLSKNFTFSLWEKIDSQHTCVRICTSWATTQAQVDTLLQAIKAL